jgi:hypothetical protein
MKNINQSLGSVAEGMATREPASDQNTISTSEFNGALQDKSLTAGVELTPAETRAAWNALSNGQNEITPRDLLNNAAVVFGQNSEDLDMLTVAQEIQKRY